MSDPLLHMSAIVKSYGEALVLDHVDFDLHAGEVHVLSGENGAGKSTLMKILAGAIHSDGGTITIEGKRCDFRSPRDAVSRGIATIYQELSLVGPMTVAENITLGHKGMLFHNRADIERVADDALRQFGADIDVRATVDDLPIASKQIVEIARAIHSAARILVMDEPTSALNAHYADRLLAIVRNLADEGHGIIFVSHRMEEMFRIADRITVLRDGKNVVTHRASTIDVNTLIHDMVGRDVTQLYPSRNVLPGEAALSVRKFHVRNHAGRNVVDDVTFDVCKGEILGLAGLQGSGVSDLLQALYGASDGIVVGSLKVAGVECEILSPHDALEHGIAYVGGDRTSGIVPTMSVEENLLLASLMKRTPFGWVNETTFRRDATQLADEMDIAVRHLPNDMSTLSGGNQQKVLLARARATAPTAYLLDDPTRGVDIGVRHEMYNAMNAWTESGCAIVLASSDMLELLAMSDRIMVLHEGKNTSEFAREEATAALVLAAAVGIDTAHAGSPH